MLVLAFVVLGAVEQCVYDNGDCTGTGTCVSDANDTLAELVADAGWYLLPTFAENFHRCVYIGSASSNGVQVSQYTQWTCSNDSVKIEYHDNQDCSNNVSTSTECAADHPWPTGCSQAFSLNQCTGSGQVYKREQTWPGGVQQNHNGGVKYMGYG